MNARTTTDAPTATSADTIAVGVFEDEGVAHDLEGGLLTALLDSGEAKRTLKHVALVHAEGKRWLLVGCGLRAEFDPERARIAAATAYGRAADVGSKALCWEAAHHLDDAVLGGIVEGTLLAAYRFDRYRSKAENDHGPAELIVSAHGDVAAPVARAVEIARAVNEARDLQNTPANDMTPTALAEHAQALEGVKVEVEGRAQIAARGMGAFAAVARGSDEEPRLITIRHEPAGAVGPHLVYVGKAVTFDSGGISLKPGKAMAEMKFDMSGGAAVVAALGALARLEVPVRVTGVVGATENLPSGHAMRPSDVLRTLQGTTIEVINTDAEGRLVLADCLAYGVQLGAERLVDIATLTGSIMATFESTYSGLFSNDDQWATAVGAAGESSGELAWRMPLHDEYEDLIKGKTGDIVNAVEGKGAGAITAAHFLRHFVGNVPWVHLDIAGAAWNSGRAYAAKGGSGYGVRTLIELAEGVSRAG